MWYITYFLSRFLDDICMMVELGRLAWVAYRLQTFYVLLVKLVMVFAMECPDPGSITHAQRELSDLMFAEGARVVYTCEPGFTARGTRYERYCLSGAWLPTTTPECQRVRCGDPESGHNAVGLIAGSYPGDHVTYVCRDGYEIEAGEEKRICQENKTWSGEPLRCKGKNCRAPDVGEGADLTVLSTLHGGGGAKYTCKTGYVGQSGDVTRTCKADGSWDGAPLMCAVAVLEAELGKLENGLIRSKRVKRAVECPYPELYANTSISNQSRSVGDAVYYTCIHGHELVQGNDTRICQADQTWSGLPPVCHEVRCPDPGPTENATRPGTPKAEYVYRDTINYTCLVTHEVVVTNLSRTCLANRAWSAEPQCVPLACSVPTVQNAIKNGTTHQVGHVIRYECMPGYNLTSGSTELTCQPSNTWAGSTPVCERANCGNPGNIANAQINGNSFVFEDIVTYQCDPGYDHKSGSGVRECLSNASWSGPTPRCDLVDCGRPAPIDHVTMSGTEFVYQKQVTFACALGYERLSGDFSRTCQANGKWSGSPPICQGVLCPDPGPGENVNRFGTNLRYRDRIQYMCKPGYVMGIGRQSLTCQADRSWDGAALICNRVNCGNITVGNNTRVVATGTLFEDTIQIICDEKYIIRSGSDKLSCAADGKWTPQQGICKERPVFEILGAIRRSVKTHETENAKTVGTIALALMITLGVIIVLLDCATISRDFGIMKRNVTEGYHWMKGDPPPMKEKPIKLQPMQDTPM